jgi:hypothetical protein
VKDYFGNPYVQSSWTRFVFVWQSIGFEDKRNAALMAWTGNIIAKLQAKGLAVESVLSITSNFGGSVVYQRLRLPSISKTEFMDLGLSEYDILTKRGVDPMKYVVDNLTWWAAHPSEVEAI